MRLPVFLAAVCCAGTMSAAPPQIVNLPAGISAQKIISTPDTGFLVLAGSEVLRYSSGRTLISTWVAPGAITDFALDSHGNLYVTGTSKTPVAIVNSSVPTETDPLSFFIKLDTSYSNVLISARFGDSSSNSQATLTQGASKLQFSLYVGSS